MQPQRIKTVGQSVFSPGQCMLGGERHGGRSAPESLRGRRQNGEVSEERPPALAASRSNPCRRQTTMRPYGQSMELHSIMSQTLLWLLLAFAVALVLVAAVLYRELKNQHHIWHDPCVTPDQARGDIGIVLRVFHEVLKDKDVVWWLDYGTLLGAWRVNGPMAFDHDVDISFLGIHEPQIRACRDEFARHGVEIDLERTSIFTVDAKSGTSSAGGNTVTGFAVTIPADAAAS
jgi:hypothetical protein